MYWPLLFIPVAVFFYLRLQLTKGKLPRGPHEPVSEDDRRTKLHLILAKWAKNYGDCFSFNMGSSNLVALNSVEAIEELLVKRGNIYSSRPASSPQADIVTGRARIVNLPYGEQFRKHRKLYNSLLGMGHAKTFLPYQEYESRQTLKNLLDTPELFYQEMARYSGSVTFSLLVGARFKHSDIYLPKQMGNMMMKFFNNIRPGAWITDRYPTLNYLPDVLAPWRARARKIFADINEFWSVFLSSIEGRISDGSAPDCFASRFLQSPEAVNFDQAERVATTATLLSAGTETTAVTMQGFFKAMVVDPEWIKEAQKELDQVVGRERLPDFSDRANLPYINAVVAELHRWTSVAPLAFFHATSEADTYRDYSIPKGTIIVPNTYAVHYSESNFPEPCRFFPQRWLPTSDARHAYTGASPPHHFAFGTGRRECPGKHVADASLFILISRILWAFDVSLGGNRMPGDESVGVLPVVGPAPFKCTIQPRSEDTASKIRALAAKIDPDLMVEDSSIYDERILAVLEKQSGTPRQKRELHATQLA